MKPQKITLVILMLLFASCVKKNDDIEFNKTVLTQILPSIVDSTCVDVRLYLNPPPKFGEYVFDKEGRFLEMDTTKVTPAERARYTQWEKNVEQIEKDTSKVFIAFDPKILPFDSLSIQNNPKSNLPNTPAAKGYILDINSIKLNGKFKLKNINKFDRKNIFETKYNFNFSGILSVSTIKFDTKKENGILEVGFLCGRLCGYGYTVYIKKAKNKWSIVKMEETWIS
jgi:hypothetical protein